MRRDRLWIGGMAYIGPMGNGEEAAVGLWLDPNAGIVATTAESPASLDLGALLARACKEPMVGRPRRPIGVRVADDRLARAIARSGVDVRVEVGPTPEIDALVAEFLAQAVPEPEPPTRSFVGKPWRRATPRDLARVEPAAARFSAGRPWEWLDSDTDVRVRAPSLGCGDAIAIVVGQSGENFGFALFSTVAQARTFRRAAQDGTAWTEQARLDDDFLMADFDPEDPQESMVVHVRPGWESLLPDASELSLVAAVAEALARFRAPGGEARVGPVTLSLRGPARVVPLAPPKSRRPGRNDPCWCGSGKKYKRCHLDADNGAPGLADADVGRTPWHDTTLAMTGRLLDWAGAHLAEWRDAADAAHLGPPHVWIAHLLFALPLGRRGPTAAAIFRAEAGPTLTARERRWLDANLDDAWTSYWRVEDAVPGRSITLRDIFSEEVRTAAETSASRTVTRHDLLCARVVTIGQDSYIVTSHPRTFGPREEAILRREVAATLRLTKRKAVPVAKLRAPKVVVGLLQAWEMLVQAAASRKPILRNTDDEALVLVTERFRVATPRGRLSSELEALPGLERGGTRDSWTLTRPGNAKHDGWEDTLIARLRLEGDALVVETNSIERADAVRAQLEARLGDAIQQRGRETRAGEDVLAEAQQDGARPSLTEVPPPEAQAAIAEMKRKTYARWPDAPLPALRGRTAREAVKTAAGRREVATLLDDMERRELRELPSARFDVDILRRALGLA